MSQSPRPLQRTWFFVVTLLIATAAWVIALVGQSLVTAQISNVTIGPLWLAIVIQLFILLQLLSALSASSPYSLAVHTPLLTSLLPISTVLAAIGIDNNLFPSSEPSSQKLTAAGWMMTAIINCIWIIALTAGDGTRTRNFFDIIIGHNRSPEIANGADAGVVYGPAYGYYGPGAAASAYDTEIPMATRGLSPRTSTGTAPKPQTQRSKPLFGLAFKPLSNRLRRRPRSEALPANTNPNERPDPRSPTPTLPENMQIPTIPSMATRSEPFAHSPQQQTTSSLYRDPAHGSEGNGSRAQGGSATGGDGEGTRASSVTQTDGAGRYGSQITAEPEHIPATTTPLPTIALRAKAMYSYTASTSDPAELSFKKGDVLQISDNSGKWWEAVKADGSKGIAPSNYLQVL